MLIIKDIFLLLLEEAQQRSKNARSDECSSAAELFCRNILAAPTSSFWLQPISTRCRWGVNHFQLWCCHAEVLCLSQTICPVVHWTALSKYNFQVWVFLSVFCSSKASMVKVLPPQTVWICYGLPISNITNVINPLWCSFFSPSTCNAFLYRIVSSDITAVLARTPAYSIFPPSHVSRM